MKAARLSRGPSTNAGTFGRLMFGGGAVYSLELPWRDNLRQRSCIPPGRYLCALRQSPKFGRVYEVRDVPGRSDVLIHAANLAGDVDLGLTTQLHGCIAPALRLGRMTNQAGMLQDAALVSSPALRQLMDWAGAEPFTLEITAWES